MTARVAAIPAANRQTTMALATSDAGRKPSLASPSRDEALDYVKGSLVLLMVLYHWVNYYIGPDWGGYRYIRFLTPSFILITGLVVSRVYLTKYAHDSPALRRRLVQRGGKLLLLFGVLNLVDTMLAAPSVTINGFAALWPASRVEAVFGNGNGAAAFGILVPIAYFLILAPFVVTLSKLVNLSLTTVAALAVSTAIAASLAGFANAHVEILSIAFIGLAVGAESIHRIEQVIRRPRLIWIAYVLYIVAITVLNVPFPLQVVGVCLSTLLLYVIGRRWHQPQALARQVVLLGRYSLFAYIAQIAVLQVLRRGFRPDALAGVDAAVLLVFAVLMTFGAVRVMVALRLRFRPVDRAYRAIFA